jgi:DNA-binding transcriptional ArsR family regulator
MDGFALIADPTRRRILDRLRDADASVGDLIGVLDLAQPLVSKHLRALREAGAVSVRVAGRRRVYSLAEDPLPEVVAWVSPYYRMWADSFDRLAEALDRKETP